MAVFKSVVRVRGPDGAILGWGNAFVHLRLGADEAQSATGTVSLRSWAATEEPPVSLELEDGRVLPIEVSRDVLSECSRNHILRYRASWPPSTA